MSPCPNPRCALCGREHGWVVDILVWSIVVALAGAGAWWALGDVLQAVIW